MFVFTTPAPGQSWLAVTLSARYARTIPLGVVAAWIDAFSDVYILVLPIVGVWSLHLPLRKKVGVLLIFMSGSL